MVFSTNRRGEPAIKDIQQVLFASPAVSSPGGSISLARRCVNDAQWDLPRGRSLALVVESHELLARPINSGSPKGMNKQK